MNNLKKSEQIEKMNDEEIINKYKSMENIPPWILKRIFFASAKYDEDLNTRHELCKKVTENGNGNAEIVVFMDSENAIIKNNNSPFSEVAYTFVINGKPSSHYYKTADVALLGYLGYKHLGCNSQFEMLAYKMLRED